MRASAGGNARSRNRLVRPSRAVPLHVPKLTLAPRAACAQSPKGGVDARCDAIITADGTWPSTTPKASVRVPDIGGAHTTVARS